MELNLVQHRGATNVWDRAERRDLERWLVAAAAGALLAAAVRERSPFRPLLAATGGALVCWAALPADQRTHLRHQLREMWPGYRSAETLVSEASEESFPASDAPAWTPTHAAPPGRFSGWH